MDYRKLALAVALALICVVGALIYVRDNLIEKTEFIPDITDLTKNYLAEEEIKAALEKRGEADIQPAEVITTLQDGAPRLALVFDGMPDRPLAAKLLDVLARHKTPAVFFLEGENVADEPEVIKLIRQAGQEVGNYTYVGLAALEKRTPGEQIREICRGQKAVTMNDSLTPTLFRAPRTVYTDELLKSVRAAGLEYAVKENVRFQPGSLHSQEEADAFAAAVANGSIIAIPVEPPVEQKADDPAVHEEKPAVDMKPTIQDGTPNPPIAKVELDKELDLLLTAMEKQGKEFIYVNQFRKIHYIPAGLPLPESTEGGQE